MNFRLGFNVNFLSTTYPKFKKYQEPYELAKLYTSREAELKLVKACPKSRVRASQTLLTKGL